MSEQKYLLIENPGVAPIEAFTLLGASNKAGTEAIGQFGSGTKFGLLALLRKKCSPSIFCGLAKLEFGTKVIKFDGEPQEQVFYKLTGQLDGKQVNRTEFLSLVLRYGEIDWKDPKLALREFVSNALDAVDGDKEKVTVEIVSTIRAKRDVTRVYIPITEEIEVDCLEFVDQLSKWFLHFGEFADCVGKTSIIRKSLKSNARIYRRGVFVREVQHVSVFDYNLNNLKLDEARVANDYSTKWEAASTVRDCQNIDVLTDLLLNCKEKDWEWSFSYHNIYDWENGATKQQKQELWAKVQTQVIGDKTIFATKDQNVEQAKGKGYQIHIVSPEFLELCEARNLRTVKTVLTADERNGRIVDEVTDQGAIDIVDLVWSDLTTLERTRGENKPAVKSFVEEVSGGGRTLGLWRDGTVYINKCLLGGGFSRELYAVALEELAHHITKATDNSRDFQEFFIQTCVTLVRGK